MKIKELLKYFKRAKDKDGGYLDLDYGPHREWWASLHDWEKIPKIIEYEFKVRETGLYVSHIYSLEKQWIGDKWSLYVTRNNKKRKSYLTYCFEQNRFCSNKSVKRGQEDFFTAIAIVDELLAPKELIALNL